MVTLTRDELATAPAGAEGSIDITLPLLSRGFQELRDFKEGSAFFHLRTGGEATLEVEESGQETPGLRLKVSLVKFPAPSVVSFEKP